MSKRPHREAPAIGRRRLLTSAGAGTVIAALGALYVIVDDHPAYAQSRKDGRPRVPPGQRVISRIKPMGGEQGDPSASRHRLRVHGEVERSLELDFRQLLALPQTTRRADVHCVTGWTLLDAEWTGVTLREIAKRAKPKKGARHVIFEAAHGYTANVPIDEALAPNVMVVHRHDGKRLRRAHGAPLRALVPDLYFWKSAKWLTGIRFVRRDEPGFWERRGYHNHGDPWKEERHG